jgi:hypothetical protein
MPMKPKMKRDEKMKYKMKKLFAVTVFLLVIMSLVIMPLVSAEPAGVSITSNTTNYGRVIAPANRTDPGGSITTMVLDAIQQDTKWKAYIGNITGSLRLDDSAGNSIYQWSLGAASVTGEIYASRSSSITWSSVNCTNLATIQSEQTALGITAGDTDSIQNTFNTTTHPGFVVAGRGVVVNTCNATSTLVNNARQAQGSADFPEMLLYDTTNLIYATLINQDSMGYMGGAATYDFQMIVADDPSVASTTYYFYAELGS